MAGGKSKIVTALIFEMKTSEVTKVIGPGAKGPRDNTPTKSYLLE